RRRLFFFQAEDGIRDKLGLEFRRVLFRSHVSRNFPLPRLSAAHWPTGAYRREDLPERVLQFGTGMLLRALCATFVDAANTAGTRSEERRVGKEWRSGG